MYIVDFPWYDSENVAPYLDRFWSVLRTRLIEGGLEENLLPEKPCRHIHFSEQWRAPNLLLSQACGFDVITTYRDELKLLAAPSYDIDGLLNGHYFSYIVTHEDNTSDDLERYRGKNLAINSHQSHSGMNIFRCVLKSQMDNFDFNRNLIISGAHIRSLELIREKKADLAAIDGVTYHLLEKHDPAKLMGSRIIRRTPAVTSCPYITNKSLPNDVLQVLEEALFKTFADPSLKDILNALLLKGINKVDHADYEVIEKMNAKYGS